MEGANLSSLLGEIANSGCTIPAERLYDWARSLWECLHTVHARGFVFGDLKPPNLIVDKDGSLCLIDFELTQAPGAGLYPGFGTRGYSSPEQLAGRKALDVDVFVDSAWAIVSSVPVKGMILRITPSVCEYSESVRSEGMRSRAR